MKKERVIVKIFQWHDLLCLAIDDLCRKQGISDVKSKFHYVCGLDFNNKPFIRLDLTRRDVARKRRL